VSLPFVSSAVPIRSVRRARLSSQIRLFDSAAARKWSRAWSPMATGCWMRGRPQIAPGREFVFIAERTT
jgi:hypothetical protein